GRVRAAAGCDGAGEDAPLLLHRRARRGDPRRDAALRLHRERGGERSAARGPRDRGAGRVRRPDGRERGAGARADRHGGGGGADGARDGGRLLATSRGRRRSSAVGPRAPAKPVRAPDGAASGASPLATLLGRVQGMRDLWEEALVRPQPEPFDGGHEAALRPEPPACPPEARREGDARLRVYALLEERPRGKSR